MIKQKCNKCREEKELNKENFYRSRRLSSGFKSECKKCVQKSNANWSKKYKESRDWVKMFIG